MILFWKLQFWLNRCISLCCVYRWHKDAVGWKNEANILIRCSFLFFLKPNNFEAAVWYYCIWLYGLWLSHTSSICSLHLQLSAFCKMRPQLASIQVTLYPGDCIVNCQEAFFFFVEIPRWLRYTSDWFLLNTFHVLLFERSGKQKVCEYWQCESRYSSFLTFKEKHRQEACRTGKQMRGNELADESDGEPHVQRQRYERGEWNERKITLIKVACYSQASGRQRGSLYKRRGFTSHLSLETGSERT